MPDENGIEHELREQYPQPSAAATADARAAVTALGRPTRPRRRRFVALALAVTAVAAGAAAAILVVHEGTTKARAGIPSFDVAATYSTTGTQAQGQCPVLYHKTSDGTSHSYFPVLSDSAGPAGSTVTISAPLPVLDEAGHYVGPGNPDITAYLNLDFAQWDSVIRSNEAPVPSVAGAPVDDLGTHHVAGGCNFQMQVTIPSVPPGTYPIVFLYRYPGTEPNGGSTFDAIPEHFQVTAG